MDALSSAVSFCLLKFLLKKDQIHAVNDHLREETIQGMQGMAFPRVQFSNFFLGQYAPRAFGADSPLVSPVTLLLNVELQKNPCLNKTKDTT